MLGLQLSQIATKDTPARLDAFRHRAISFDPHSLNTGWEDVLVAEGLALYGRAFDDGEALTWVHRWLEHHLGVPIAEDARYIPSFTTSGELIRGVKLCDYCGNWGLPLAAVPYGQGAYVRERREEEASSLAGAVRQIADYVLEHAARGARGVIRHGGFTEGIWVDTLYYAAAPLAKAYSLTGEAAYAKEALRQCLLHAELLRDPLTGLFFHDYDPTLQFRTTGFWSRGNGWVIVSFAEVLARVPQTMPGYAELRDHFVALATALLRLRHATGLWRIIPDNPDSHLETSGSVMIALGLALGIAGGLLDPNTIAVVMETLAELTTWIETDPRTRHPGALMGSEQPAGVGGWEIHKTVPLGESTYTTGLFLKLLATVKALGMDVPHGTESRRSNAD
ncbi:MAG: glycoside hydrolase family 88 protein [Spirochaetales bacterium]